MLTFWPNPLARLLIPPSVKVAIHRHGKELMLYQFLSKDRLRTWINTSGPVFRALALRFGDSRFKTRSDHSLNLILVVPDSTSQLYLQIANQLASGQLGFLTVVVVVVVVVLFRHFVVFHWPWNAPMGSGQLSMYCIILRSSQKLLKNTSLMSMRMLWTSNRLTHSNLVPYRDQVQHKP